MSSMFDGSSFNQDLSDWETAKVMNFSRMFYDNRGFNQPISEWDTSSGIYFDEMFSWGAFNQDISSWDVGKACYLEKMFENSPFNQSLYEWGPQLNDKRCEDNTAPDVTDMFRDTNCPDKDYATPILNHYCYAETAPKVSGVAPASKD